MTNDPKGTSAPQRSSGRGLLWLALGLVVLSIVQYGLGRLIIPWYLPGLTTLAALLVLVSLLRWRTTMVRIVLFLLLAALAGLEWHFLLSAARLPDYAGPARAGKTLPPFRTTLASGAPFTDADLRDGERRALIFYRGRW